MICPASIADCGWDCNAVGGAGATTTVTQTTQRAIVNWQRFSIGAGETTRFVQPGAASAILNRVTGGDPSKLMGQLTSNGRVYLINPHGVVVGPDGRVTTGGFVASTLDVPIAANAPRRLELIVSPVSSTI